RHVRLGPGLVDEHQLRRVQSELAHLPRRPLLADVRAVLLGGVDRLFLYVSFSSRNALQIAQGVTDTPMRSRSSTSVASGCAFANSARRSWSILRPRDPPPLRGTISPRSRLCCLSRRTHAGLTLYFAA